MYKIPANTLFLGKNLVFVPECHSTNSLALELCQQGTPEGTLIITNRQTRGRGQRGNTWESQPEMNLTFSLVLKPAFLAVKDQFFLNVFASLAVCDCLAELCPPASIGIKWPNDILANEFKICGILIENQLSGEQFTNVVLGIGLNINQQEFSSPLATSLSMITGKSHGLPSILEKLLSHLEARYIKLRQRSLDDLRADYLKYMYRLNEEHTFLSGEEQFKGKITGVDEHGRLRVVVQGVEKAFGIKEISFV